MRRLENNCMSTESLYIRMGMERLLNKYRPWDTMLGTLAYYSLTSVRWWEQEYSVHVSISSGSVVVLIANIYVAGSILKALESVGLSILYWIFGFVIAACMDLLSSVTGLRY